MGKIKDKIIKLIDYIFGFESVQKPHLPHMKTWYETGVYDKKRLNIPQFKPKEETKYMSEPEIDRTLHQCWVKVGEKLLSNLGDENVIPATELMIRGLAYKELDKERTEAKIKRQQEEGLKEEPK